MDVSAQGLLTDDEIKALMAQEETLGAGQVYVQDMSAASLAQLLASLRPQLPYAIVESSAAIAFLASDEPIAPTQWPNGRAFGPRLEIRWELCGDGAHVMLVCNACLAAWQEYLDLASCETVQRFYYLWGPDNVALGRALDYRALPGKGRPQLIVREYCDPDDGRLVFTRDVEMRREGTT